MSFAKWTPGISVKDLHLFPPFAGCYAFYFRRKVVYIGSSMNLRIRIRNHKITGSLKSVTAIRTRLDRRYAEHRTLEYRLIKLLKPKRNLANNGQPGCIEERQCTVLNKGRWWVKTEKWK